MISALLLLPKVNPHCGANANTATSGSRGEAALSETDNSELLNGTLAAMQRRCLRACRRAGIATPLERFGVVV